jgi:hypothetical protein
MLKALLHFFRRTCRMQHGYYDCRSARDRLAVVTCHFNPCGYRRLRENYFRFRAALAGARLFTIEVSFDGRFHLPSEWRIKADPRKHLMWQKEALLNEAIRRLPDQYDQVAWIDHDLLFLNPEWADQTSELLDLQPVVQLFEKCHFTDELGRLDNQYPSLVAKRRERLTIHGMPGGAWAARRELIEQHGIYDRCILGSGDTVFTDALFGERNSFFDKQASPALLAHYRPWQVRLYRDVRGDVGCTPGDVVHLFHGTRRNRRYVERNEVMRANRFDPAADVRLTPEGLLEYSSRKPSLRRGVEQYFADRREDETAAAA